MRRILRSALFGAILLVGSASTSSAQVSITVSGGQTSVGYYSAPGYHGTRYGFASYGVPRLYSEFASPYGGGYGYGYAPYAIIPNQYGLGIWRPGYSVSGLTYGYPGYGTYSVQRPGVIVPPPPPIGAYAPGFGPPPAYLYGTLR